MSLRTALDLVESASDMKVLFVGDTIVDEYQYVTPLGKSPKEHIVVTRHVGREEFMGGVHAAAAHARTFCEQVDVVTGGPVTRKVRMVDELYTRKLFEVHHVEAGDSLRLPATLEHYDAVVVTDFGHGAVSNASVVELTNRSQFLAANAQTNSANVGFNLITKYPTPDYVVIDEPEARLAAGDRDGSIEDVIVGLARGNYGKMVVTLGSRGAIGWDGESERFSRCPAMTQRVIDTMGAGDAFLAVTAPMAARGGAMEDLLLIGCAAGALKTQIVGHRESVTKKALLEYMWENRT
jgi:bifunctional ADP-heptose synthase (sugar kinase/adenylyltransferase)